MKASLESQSYCAMSSRNGSTAVYASAASVYRFSAGATPSPTSLFAYSAFVRDMRNVPNTSPTKLTSPQLTSA